MVIRTPPIPRRKGSWISKPRHERTQSCRRISSRRDWSGELEESEYHLPFPVATEETERGGHGVVQRIVSFQDEKGGLPQLDTSFAGQGLMIDVDSHIVAERVEDEADRMSSSVGTESSSVESLDTFTSVDTYTSVVDSEWTALSQEADGIEMYF